MYVRNNKQEQMIPFKDEKSRFKERNWQVIEQD